MKDIIRQLKGMADIKASFYEPVGQEKISNYEERNGLLPSEYKELISLSDGIGVTEYYDCRIHGLKLVDSLNNIDYKGNAHNPKKKILDIGTFWEDYLFIDSNNSVFLSFQGIEEPVKTDMTLKKFLQKCIDTDFEIFWDEEINIIM